ncbi:LuxR family transcriptional regulator [Roseibium aquae]|uniref:LuxR family transcriptional regulator n=1 Tax=Roseibium aquae TaxID=1323746 RepID=A0A916TGY9_9HYPH|nr:TatD family hydrolase [Roseibium aquae]GGB44720.1 LuxR family transcriptional regulator [Roseibium aquae]
MLVDSHCHLDFPDFDGEHVALIQRAREAGVGLMVTICTRVRKFPQVLAVAEAHPQVFCSVGTHPHNAGEEAGIPARDIAALTEHPKVVAVGEAGLDYFYDKSPREDQKSGLRTHIAVARETGLPLVIHARDADEDMEAILREEMRNGAFPALLHCFSSGRGLALAGIDLGLYVSFSGILTFKRSEELRGIARDLPADRLLVETDAPYLAPQPRRGKRNEPAYTAMTAAVLAETRGVDFHQICAQTTENFFRLFKKVPKTALAASEALT